MDEAGLRTVLRESTLHLDALLMVPDRELSSRRWSNCGLGITKSFLLAQGVQCSQYSCGRCLRDDMNSYDAGDQVLWLSAA